MKLVIGLGNPGREYEKTRHNVAWLLLDHVALTWHTEDWRRDGESRVTDARLGPTRVRLVKPQTYMNLSGEVLRPYQRRESWSAANDLLVVVDDVALPLGRYRLRAQGSAGGHNGLKSIEAALGSREYARLRIGIGPQEAERQYEDLSDFVLGRFGKSELAVVDELLPKLTDAIEIWIRDGIVPAMNAHNRRPSAPPEEESDIAD